MHVNCPVDVEVYDSSGKLVTSIVDDQPTEGSVYSAINENGEKIVFLPSDEDYSVEISATNQGSMTCTISEYDMLTGRVVRLLNYYDLPIEKGDHFLGVLPAFDDAELEDGTPEGSSVDYSLLDESGDDVVADEDIDGESVDENYYAVSLETNNESGIVSGGGEFLKGTFAKVEAQPLIGGKFLGWYVEDELVSSEEVYRFAVKEDVVLVANFEHVETYEIKVVAGRGGTVEGASGFYVSGTEFEIIAEADANYRFKNWTSSDGGVFEDSNRASTTFTMPNKAITITANFELISRKHRKAKTRKVKIQ
jgi:hypothetical protein